MNRWALCIAVVVLGVSSSAAPVPQAGLKVEIVGPAGQVVAGEEITIEVVLSAEDDRKHEFLLGSFPQAFGVYVLGPWGAIQPDPIKVRPENWMHQQHSAAARITVVKGKPYRTTVRLSDYFPVKDAERFKPGTYQINVKFYDSGLKMAAPIDSGPVRFEMVGKR